MNIQEFTEHVQEFCNGIEYVEMWTPDWDGMPDYEDYECWRVEVCFDFGMGDEFTIPIEENTGQSMPVEMDPILLEVGDDCHLSADAEGVFSFVAIQLMAERREARAKQRVADEFAKLKPTAILDPKLKQCVALLHTIAGDPGSAFQLQAEKILMEVEK